MAPSSAAAALRESFGDRKLPDITRKITACVACRKAKIKCRMNDSKPPCSRCKARQLPCTVNKSIQMLLENDLDWKESMERRLEQIERSLITSAISPKPSTSLESLELPPSNISNVTSTMRPPLSSLDKKSDTSSCLILNLSCSLGAFPASSLEHFTLGQTCKKPDLISTGVISQVIGEQHFRFYQENLNRYSHRILSVKDTLDNVRSRSSLLTTAICTTAAYCSGSPDYQICLNTLTREVSENLFSAHHTFDDIRALCIGAFWLDDISSALNALAVRIAAESNLHRCIAKMPHSKRACYERTRLYYLVYVCDHHCSLSHGRPPMTRELRSLKPPRMLLQSEYSSTDDLSLISQVELWTISRRVFDVFGADIESSFSQTKSAELEQLSDAYDRWRQEWMDILNVRHALDQFSKRMIDFYYSSAKLYLFSHVFRGPAQRDAQPPMTAHGMDGLAQCAVGKAMSIIRSVVDGTENQVCLTYLPCYFGKVIAFAVILLLRASWQAHPLDSIKEDEVLPLLRRLSELIQCSLAAINPAHPLLSISNSLDIAIGGRCNSINDTLEWSRSKDSPLDFDLFKSDLFGLNFLDDPNHWLSPTGVARPESFIFENLEKR